MTTRPWEDDEMSVEVLGVADVRMIPDDELARLTLMECTEAASRTDDDEEYETAPESPPGNDGEPKLED